MNIEYRGIHVFSPSHDSNEGFYKKLLTNKELDEQKGYTLFTDNSSRQAFCLSPGEKDNDIRICFQTDDLEKAISFIQDIGAKNLKEWDEGWLKGANFNDPAGNLCMIYNVSKEEGR